ncbi:MAG: hypothetical protein ACOC3V_02880, partial [bacterium]
MDYIFKQDTCLKKDFYYKLIEILENNGWENISSNEETDFSVMTSSSLNNNRKLILNIRPTNTGNNNDTTTTSYSMMTVRLPVDYIPGNENESGEFINPGTWLHFNIYPSNSTTSAVYNMDTPLKLNYYCDKNLIIMIIEYPEGTSINPIVFYLGLPHELYGDPDLVEPDNRGVVFAQSHGNTTLYGASGELIISDSHYTTASVGVSSIITARRKIYNVLPPKNPNIGNYILPTSAYYGNVNEGWRGKLTGLKFIPNQNVSSGDIVVIGDKQ